MKGRRLFPRKILGSKAETFMGRSPLAVDDKASMLQIGAMKRKRLFLWVLAVSALLPQPEVAATERTESELERLRSWARDAERSAKEWLEEVLREDSRAAVTGPLSLGVVVESVPKVLREHVDLAPGIGLLIRAVQPDSPAEAGGLEANDILVAYRDQLLVNHEQLVVLLQLEEPQAVVEFQILRRGEEKHLTVTLRGASEAAEPTG